MSKFVRISADADPELRYTSTNNILLFPSISLTGNNNNITCSTGNNNKRLTCPWATPYSLTLSARWSSPPYPMLARGTSSPCKRGVEIKDIQQEKKKNISEPKKKKKKISEPKRNIICQRGKQYISTPVTLGGGMKTKFSNFHS